LNLHIGASGFGYKEWKGKFFPKDIKPTEMLPFYASHFHAVEINNTFYSLPKGTVLKSWLKQVPPNFIFGLKAPQKITHILRLKSAARPLRAFLKLADILGPQLGPLLFQLPPNFKIDLPRFKKFLAHVPPKYRIAFEFRHPSWLTPEVFDTLRARNAALCIAESEDTIQIPFEPTANWGYLRLRRLDYKPRDLKSWAQRILSQNWSEAFVFFKHEERALGPKFATRFSQLIQKNAK
jgi:uncharacterized protein YecE (DUF72 family)